MNWKKMKEQGTVKYSHPLLFPVWRSLPGPDLWSSYRKC